MGGLQGEPGHRSLGRDGVASNMTPGMGEVGKEMLDPCHTGGVPVQR